MMVLLLLLVGLGPAGGCSSPVVHGVRPIDPPLASILDPAPVDSVQPTFRWRPHGRWSGYDLVVARPIPWTARLPHEIDPSTVGAAHGEVTLVYYRENLSATEHRIEIPLEPDTVYIWSVRTRRGFPEVVSGWSTFDAQLPLTHDEVFHNLTLATGYAVTAFGLGVLSMGAGPDLGEPPYVTGETRVLEYHPFTFRTPPESGDAAGAGVD
jgi:hypothetical protein